MEPRGSRAAVGEVELPPRLPTAARTRREHELPGDAGRPHAFSSTQKAPSPQRTRVIQDLNLLGARLAELWR